MPQAAGAVPLVPPILSYLRAHTKAAHAQTEAMPSLLALLSPKLDRALYGQALTGLYIFQASLQAALAPRLQRLGAAIGVNPAPLTALRADLAWLGVDLPALPGRRVKLGSGLAVYGALYVLEGSALGGRVIGRHVSEVLGVAPGSGGDFFCGLDAAAARRRWVELCAALADLPMAAAPSVLEGALNAFALLEGVMRPPSARARLPEAPVISLPVMTRY